MPWCVTCDRYLSPSTVNPDGTCRTCGRAVETGAGGRRATAPATGTPQATSVGAETHDPEERVPLPWHLWALLAALVIYLGFRFWQGIEALWNWAL